MAARRVQQDRLRRSEVSPYTRLQRGVRAGSFACVCPIAKRSPDAPLYLEQRWEVDTRIAQAHTLVLASLGLVRERRGGAWNVWRGRGDAEGD